MNAAMAEAFCPYVGLQPYTEAERDYFFGRERDQRIISANLYAAPLTVLYGASGVGKSSVLLAGVLPYLRTKPRTAVVIFREWQRGSFLEALKFKCLEAVVAAQQEPLIIDLTLPFDELLYTATQAFAGSILILFDQFEEYFLYHPESEAGNTFDIEFARAVNREEVDASFLIALRDDGLSKLDRFRARIPNLLGNTLRLQHLTAADAEAAIRKPLEVYNERFSASLTPITIEDELVHAITAQVKTGQVLLNQSGGVGHARTHDETIRIEAPFLQLVMTRLWEEEMLANSRVLRLSTFQQLGGAQEIVRTHLDGVMAKLDAAEQEVCSHFFDRLVTPSGSKVACRVDDLTKWAKDLAPHVPSVLMNLSDNRILRSVANPGEQYTASSYEVYHDVLAPAILDWRVRYVHEQERAKAEQRAVAEVAAQQKEAIRQKELEHAQALFQEQRRRVKVSRWMSVALAVMLLFAAVGWGWALEQARRASSNELAARVINNLDADPELGILLALHAVTKTVTPDSENALRQALRTSRLQLTLSGHSEQLRDVVFSPDGKLLATASWDHTAKIWDAVSGNLLTTLSGHNKNVNAVALSPDSTHLATASEDGTVNIWDARADRRLPLWSVEHDGEATVVAFSPDGKLLATAGKDQKVKFWDTLSASELFTLSVKGRWIVSLAFSSDGQRIAIASVDPPSSTELWDISSRGRLFNLPGQINAVAFSPDGKLLATAGRDKTAKIWDATTGQNLRTLAGHIDQVRDIAFSPDGTRLVTASADRTARVWDAATGQLLFTLAGHTDWINGIAFSPDGARLATASRDNTAKVWNANAHTDAVYGVAFSPDGKHLATASGDNTAKVWDVKSGQGILSLVGHTDTVYKLAFSPDGKLLATASFDKTAKIWDASTAQLMHTLDKHKDQLRDIAFSPDGTRLVTASADRTAKMWNTASGELLFTLNHDDQVQGVAFRSDGNRLVTASWDGKLKLWDANTGQELFTIYREKFKFNAVAFSPDGTRLVSASVSPKVRIWDAALGNDLLTLAGHSKYVNSVVFSPDGTRLASASGDMTAKVWDVSSSKEQRTLAVHTDVVNDIAFSPDGKLLATASSDRTFQVSPLAIGELIALAKARVTRSLTSEECQKYLHMQQCPIIP